MPTAESSIEIAAPVDLVWQVMIDVDRYREWNPFIVSIDSDGKITVGSSMTLHVRWEGGGGASSGERVTRMDAPIGGKGAFEYSFTGWMHTLAMVRATRVQTVEELAPRSTRYHTRESFGGWLAGAIPLKKVQRGFELHAQALKTRAESLAATAP
jgi:hypothetical protein